MEKWVRLRKGDDDRRVVLAVDFGGARAEAGFPELAAHLSPELTVLASEPPPHLIAEPDEAHRHIEAWREAVADAPVTVEAVLAYCSGAAIATRLAADIARRHRQVPVVLIDPARASHELLLDAYRFSAAPLADSLGEAVDASPALSAGIASGTPAAEEELVRLGRRLSAAYASLATRAGDELELLPDLVQDLIDRFDRYTAYLVVACVAENRPMPVTTGRTLTIMSAAHPAAALPDTDGPRIRFDVTREQLLAEPDVGGAAMRFIADRP